MTIDLNVNDKVEFRNPRHQKGPICVGTIVATDLEGGDVMILHKIEGEALELRIARKYVIRIVG